MRADRAAPDDADDDAWRLGFPREPSREVASSLRESDARLERRWRAFVANGRDARARRARPRVRARERRRTRGATAALVRVERRGGGEARERHDVRRVPEGGGAERRRGGGDDARRAD
jgi:hypothetical protein